MKFLIVVTILLAVAHANPFEVFLNQELGYPFKYVYAYMQCVPTQIDQLAFEYGCDSVWDEHRKPYLHAISEFENCVENENDVDSDRCRYEGYHLGESVLRTFYSKLKKNHDKCWQVVPKQVAEQCESDELRYGPDW